MNESRSLAGGSSFVLSFSGDPLVCALPSSSSSLFPTSSPLSPFPFSPWERKTMAATEDLKFCWKDGRTEKKRGGEGETSSAQKRCHYQREEKGERRERHPERKGVKWGGGVQDSPIFVETLVSKYYGKGFPLHAPLFDWF